MDELERQTEKHFATVTRNADERLGSTLRGAVFFTSETLTGGSEFGTPAEPSFPQAGKNGEGFFWVPQVGDQIEVEINRADEHPVPRYVRMLWSTEDDIPEEFKVNYPNRMGWKTRQGHLFLFDNSTPEGGPDEGLNKNLISLFHGIGTGFTWLKNGDEIKTIIRDLKETVNRNVIRVISGTLSETFKAEVTRQIFGKLTETYRSDITRKIQGNKTENITGDLKESAVGQAKFEGKAKTTLGNASSNTEVEGTLFKVNAPTSQISGAIPVARLGDLAVGTGNLGGPVISTIISGSGIVGVG